MKKIFISIAISYQLVAVSFRAQAQSRYDTAKVSVICTSINRDSATFLSVFYVNGSDFLKGQRFSYKTKVSSGYSLLRAKDTALARTRRYAQTQR